VVEANENFIRGVLKAGIGLVQLTRSLRGQLTQCITIFNVGKCPKDKIRAHIYSPSSFDRPYAQQQRTRLAQRRSIFYFYVLDATALLREQFFRLGFCRPTGTGMIPCAAKSALPAEFPRAEPYAEALLAVSLCLRLRMRLKLPACRAAVSSGPNESVTPDARLPSSEAEKPQKDAKPAIFLASPNPVFTLPGRGSQTDDGTKFMPESRVRVKPCRT
jgi:hypothetical protein